MTDPTLSDALKEAYASATANAPLIETIAIYYSGLVDGLGAASDFFVFNGDNPTSIDADGLPILTARLEASAPRKSGQAVTFLGVPFKITLPGVTTDPIPNATLSVDNIGQEAVDLLVAASQSGKAIEVVFREYMVGSELDGPENDPPITFNWVDVSAALSVTGRLVPLAIGNRRFPFETYTPSRFRTLQYA